MLASPELQQLTQQYEEQRRRTNALRVIARRNPLVAFPGSIRRPEDLYVYLCRRVAQRQRRTPCA